MSHPALISRLRFMQMLLAGATFAPGLAALGNAIDQLRGDRVGWARLRTTSPAWMRHASGDPTLMQFFREQTTLNIDPAWYVADVQSLEQMRKYPLLFSQGVHVVLDPPGRASVAEYIRRGGFLLVDACCNPNYTPNDDVFLQQHVDFFAAALPEARVAALSADHDIYRCHFEIPGGHPPHTYFNNVYNPNRAKHGLYGVTIGQRMAGLVSLSGLQCGWDRMIAPPGNDLACMKMLVNIYIYAMMQRN